MKQKNNNKKLILVTALITAIITASITFAIVKRTGVNLNQNESANIIEQAKTIGEVWQTVVTGGA